MKCIVCSDETTNPKFCSKSCSAKFNNRGRNRHGTVIKNCKNCGVKLNRSIREYCSNSCQAEFNMTNAIQSGTASSNTIKNFLIKKFGAKCMKCDWKEINPVTNKCPIELDHKDGNSKNNSIENTQLLCPNCHSLTATYKALNKGNGRHIRMQRYKEGKSY